MHRLAILLVLLAAACGGKTQGVKDPCADPCKGNTGGDDTPEPAGETVELNSLDAGDTSCGVQVTRGDGTEAYLDGDFELCEGGANDATALVGQRVVITTERGNVMAESCEGDPECTETEEVDIVTSITAAE